MAERLTEWPTRAKVSVAVLSMVLALVVGVGAAKQEADPGAAPARQPAAAPSPTTSSTSPSPSPLGTEAPVASTTPPTRTGSSAPTLAALRVVDGVLSPPGYSRDLFPTWLDLDDNGCDAREDTLVAESLVTATVSDSGCEVIEGRWLSIYDGLELTESSDLDVDHLVPLAEAWRSGASTWEPARRAAFANDLSFPDHLIAVTAAINRSKSDSPPNEWRPPRRESWCRYATAWVNVKVTWSLSATTAERDALGQMLTTC